MSEVREEIISQILYRSYKGSVQLREHHQTTRALAEEIGLDPRVSSERTQTRLNNIDRMIENERQFGKTAVQEAKDHYDVFSDAYHLLAMSEAVLDNKVIEFSGSVATNVIVLPS